MGFVVYRADGSIYGVTSHNHLEPPDGGRVVEVDEEEEKKILEDMHKPHLPKAPPPLLVITAESLKKLRRDRMWEISNSSVAGRGRVFKGFPHIHMMDQHRHIDVLVMVMRGKLKNQDEVLTRNLKTGEYEPVTVGSLLDEIEKTYWLRQDLRRHDQNFRDKVNNIYNDKLKSLEDKYHEIAALVIPPFLAVDENRSAGALVMKE